MHKRYSAICVALLFALSSCSQHFANISQASDKCGYRTSEFEVFIDCVKKNNEVAEQEQGMTRGYKKHNGEDSSDGINLMKQRFSTELEAMKLEYKNDLFNDEIIYYDRYDKVVAAYKQEETIANNNAQAVAAIVLVGAAVVAACSNGGCDGGGGGGGSSYANNNMRCDLQGCCSYHNGVSGVAFDGRVVCNDYTYSKTCECN